MKKILFTFFLLGSLLLVSCSQNTPKAVAEKFLKALNAENYKEAQKYCDAPTGKLLNMLEELSNEAKKEAPEKQKKAKKVPFTITKVDENGDKAKVFYTIKTEHGQEREDNIELKKIDGKWLVSINKEQGKENGMQMPEDGHDHMHDHGDGDEHILPEEDIHTSQDSTSIAPEAN